METTDTTQPLSRIIEWAMAHDLVRAALLTSTRAVPGAKIDALSDYDLILIVQDLQPFVTDKSWLADFGDVLVVYWDAVSPEPNYAIEQSGNVTQYADGLKIDFTLWPVELFRQIVAAPELPDELDAGYQILLDKDNLTQHMLPPTYTAYVPRLPSEAEYLLHINDFLTDPPYVAKCLWRDEIFPAKWCLDVDMIHTYLRKLLEWRVAIDYGPAARVGALGKGLKTCLSEQLWLRVEQCFAGASPDDNWMALEHSVAVFREVAIEVGNRLGYSYPEELHQRVMAYVEHIKSEMLPITCQIYQTTVISTM